MKTRHNFEPGDRIEHNGRMGVVLARDHTRQSNRVRIEWDDGETQEGLHSKLWMCNHPTRESDQ